MKNILQSYLERFWLWTNRRPISSSFSRSKEAKMVKLISTFNVTELYWGKLNFSS